MLSPINTKYKDLKFVSTTSSECVTVASFGDFTQYHGLCFEAKIQNGKIIFESALGQKFLSEGIDNAKYITKFNEGTRDQSFEFVALTTSGDLYILSSSNEKDKKVNFKKVNYDRKIHKLFISGESDGFISNFLYVLNQDDELLSVNINDDGFYSIKGKYEERSIFFGGAPGRDYTGTVSLINKTATLEEDIIKFKGKNLTLNYLFKTYYDDVYGLYLVTEDNKIYTTKKNIDIKTCDETCHDDAWYQIVLYKDLEVKSVSYNKDVVTITYKNGTTEKIKNMYELIDLEKTYGYYYSYYSEN